MKYFTPLLLERFGSTADAVADQAQADWEQARAEYERHFTTIEGSLPPKFRDVLSRFYLHDARVLGASVEPPYFFLTLQLEAPAGDVLVFQYHLAKDADFMHSTSTGCDPCPFFAWLYDEVDVKKVDDVVFFEHAILFTNGVELRVPFDKFEYLIQSPPFDLWPSAGAQLPEAGRPQFIS